MTASRHLPTLFIPHGGGPCFFMDPMPGFPPDAWDGMAAYLRGIDSSLGARPRALLVISGHWECPRPTVNAASRHTLLYDYHGFPEHTYRLAWPAAGAPDVAARVRELLGPSDEDAEAFDAWLYDAATAAPATRDAPLAAWREAPGARACHPSAEHLTPLLVAAGAAGEDVGRRTYHERVLGKPISGFQFG